MGIDENNGMLRYEYGVIWVCIGNINVDDNRIFDWLIDINPGRKILCDNKPVQLRDSDLEWRLNLSQLSMWKFMRLA